MKITINIEDAVLNRLMKNTGITSKTKAVAYAMNEADRRGELKHLLETSLGLSDEEIIGAFDENYDLMALRMAETPSGYGKAAATIAAKPQSQTPVKHAKKPRARR